MPRPIRRVQITSRFERAFRGLPKTFRDIATVKDRWFRVDAFDPRLRTHSLKGKLKGLWSYSVTRECRILFEFLAADDILYHDIGSHAIYERR